MKPRFRHILSLVFIAASLAYSNTATSQPKIDLDKALDINELKITMAENSLKVNPSLRTLSELTSALEQSLNSRCFGDMLRTLSYQGPPQDPACLARIDRLLEVYPNNPVAVCLRDGIEAPSCRSAYQEQHLVAFSGGSSYQDPALKVGLSENDSKRLGQLSGALQDVDTAFRNAATDEQKLKSLEDGANLYDQILSIACKVAGLRLDEPADRKEDKEDPSIRDVRERLLKIPPALRGDYQRQLLQQAEEELAKAKNDTTQKKIIIQKINVIQNPDQKKTLSAAGTLRMRVVLSQCKDFIEKFEKILPDAPAPPCYRAGWYSPQCINALRNWRAYHQELSKRVEKSRPKPFTPTPSPLISTF